MALKRLLSGLFDELPISKALDAAVASQGPRYTRRALLVYEGVFQAMDGEVIVSKEDVMRLFANHNAVISHNCRLSQCGPNDLPMKDYPPLQLDHSASAKDTIGRLIGEVEVGPYIRKDGKEVLALYGNACFLGADNCEKAQDGRYTHLSVGVDFEKGSFSELTVTPFPAAPEASLLSSKGDNMDEKLKQKLKHFLTGSKKMSEEDAEKHLKRCSEDTEEMSKLTVEVDEEEKKLSLEKDALSKKLAAEKDENDKKLAFEKEKDEKEKEEKMKKMSAARAQITKLSSDFRSTSDGVQLAAKKGRITTRLAALRAEAKVTPAEIKKMDIDKLSKEPIATIEAVLKSYEDREPVIITGQFGSIKAEELHRLSTKTRVSQLEAETRANMSMLKSTVSKEDLTKLSKEQPQVQTPIQGSLEMEAVCDEVDKLLDDGKTKEAKLRVREILKTTLSYGSSAQDKLSAIETEKQISALAETANKMQTQFEELQKLAATLAEMA